MNIGWKLVLGSLFSVLSADPGVVYNVRHFLILVEDS
jgi:hypothetical protein